VFSESAYIAYKLHPNVQIYMDGREEQVWDDDIFDIEMYFLKRMGSYSNLMLDIYPPDIVLLSRHDLSNDIISNSKDWHLIYEDKLFNIYIKAELDTKNYKILNVSNKKLMDDLLKESYFMRR
ncbi:hypothetical protein IJ670_05925, partial [bacterium]|nr:hypothetical protein [bacterium]